MPFREAMTLPLAAQEALRAGVDFLTRLPEIERSVADAANRASSVLDEILARVQPLQREIEELRDSASTLEDELRAGTAEIAGLRSELKDTRTHLAGLEGSLEHLLDRVPGLSAEDAQERAKEIASG